MKVLHRYALTIVLLVGVFASSFGVTVFRHVCHSAKSSKVSFFKIKSCCGEKTSCGIKESCCETKFTWAKTGTEKKVEEKFNLPLLQFENSFVQAESIFDHPVLNLGLKALLIEKPPPLEGRDIGLRNQVFRS